MGISKSQVYKVILKAGGFRKYNHDEIIEAYKNGLSYHALEKKYGISKSQVYKVIQKAGVGRGVLKYNYDGIIEDYKKGASYFALMKKYGISNSYAYKIIKKAGVGRSLSESMALKYRERGGFRKLVMVPGKRGTLTATRIVSLPKHILQQLGFNGLENLLGRWHVENGKLFFEIKRPNRKKD